MLVEKMQAAGFTLEADRDQLIVTGAMNDGHRQFIREHKQQLLAELKSANQTSPAERLRRLAGKYRIDPDELLSWYAQDHENIKAMDDGELDAMVRDYSANRPNFRGEQPYQTYQLWFYRLDKKKAGYVRQGLMTSDKDEALRRLETIYGHGNVLDLHSDDRK